MTLPARWIASLAALSLLLGLGGCHHRPVAFERVHSGSNYPVEQLPQLYNSREELDASVLRNVMGAAAYQRLISRVEFDKQLVILVPWGPTERFSGTFDLYEVYQYTGVASEPLNIRVRMGVASEVCPGRANASPYVVALVERPEVPQSVLGMDFVTFQEACR